MKTIAKTLLLTLLAATACSADQNSLYSEVAGSAPPNGDALRKTTTINADSGWWAYLDTHGKSAAGALGKGVVELDGHMGWASPEGKVSITVDLPPGMTDHQAMGKVLDNVGVIAAGMMTDSVCHPKGDKFVLTIKFDPAANKPRGTITPDGTTYHMIAPTTSWVTTDQTTAFFKQGHK
jgi:hypothetical protein